MVRSIPHITMVSSPWQDHTSSIGSPTPTIAFVADLGPATSFSFL